MLIDRGRDGTVAQTKTTVQHSFHTVQMNNVNVKFSHQLNYVMIDSTFPHYDMFKKIFPIKNYPQNIIL